MRITKYVARMGETDRLVTKFYFNSLEERTSLRA